MGRGHASPSLPLTASQSSTGAGVAASCSFLEGRRKGVRGNSAGPPSAKGTAHRTGRAPRDTLTVLRGDTFTLAAVHEADYPLLGRDAPAARAVADGAESDGGHPNNGTGSGETERFVGPLWGEKGGSRAWQDPQNEVAA